VLVRYCADNLLDSVTSVDIMHIHGGEAFEGAAVLKHRIHAMTNDVPLFVDGAFTTVRMLEPSGQAFVRETEFRGVGTYPVYPYPHPETITLPRHVPGIQRVTNLGVVYPLSYFERTMELVREGLDPDAIVATVQAERPALLAEAGLDGAGGCLKVVVVGTAGGAEHTYVFSLSSDGAGAGEGTGIPAGLAALQVLRGDIDTPGVHPPEAILDPNAILALAGEVLPALGVGNRPDAEGGGAVPIHIEHVGPDGTSEELDLSL
jgi:saccharopine dehydrogenase (NAD+, L-lysine-forming)